MSIEELLAENARLKAEIERMEHQVKYWQIEADTDHARWLRVLEDVERLRKAGDAMAFWLDHQKNEHGHLLAESWDRSMEDAQR